MSDNNNKLIRWESLPSEIATDIFLRLPIKSIIICTSVSKAWKSLIQNPTFISTHLHHSHNKNKNLLVFSLYSQTHKESYALHNEDDPDFTQLARLVANEYKFCLEQLGDDDDDKLCSAAKRSSPRAVPRLLACFLMKGS
nr:f-box protein cpr30 [Quercus suber]